MANKSHFIFRNPSLSSDRFFYGSRFPENQEEEEESTPDYRPLAETYRRSLSSFRTEGARRIRERNPDLVVPAHITHIDIEFFALFDARNFETYYVANFGLSPIEYYSFNRRAIFAIVDEERFQIFIGELETFIRTEGNSEEYDRKIIFIKSFRFLTSELILADLRSDLPVSYLHLIDNAQILQSAVLPIENGLKKYLEQKNIPYTINNNNRTLELKNVAREILGEIVRNFDIVHSVTSSSVSLVRPTRLGEVRRESPFNVISPGEDSPIIAIIDSGISDGTKLRPIIVDGGSDYDVTGGNGKTDNVDHGTGVAAFAALGDKLIGNPTGNITSDARVLSIKVLDTHSGSLTVSEVEAFILRAHQNLGVRLFVLCVNFSQHLKTDQSISKYALLFDRLSYDKDILIFISTGNHIFKQDGTLFNLTEVNSYPAQFLDERSNICPPSESMNNISVGALGSNKEPERTEAITIGSLPTIYTRKYHLEESNQTHLNSKLFKPDVLFHGGNVELDGTGLDLESNSGLSILSTSSEIFTRYVGTSYATPLVANFAAKVLNTYPGLRLQTVKALIINSAEALTFTENFSSISTAKKRFIGGNGIPNETKCLYSDDNEVTFIVEDSIAPGNIKSYMLEIPTYLNSLTKNIGLLEFTSTLCFKFKPLPNNQVGYCPIHIAFGLAKNIPLRNGNRLLKNEDILVKGGWSQDAYYKNKMYSNAQKTRFTISRTELIDNDNKFKLVVNSRLHGSLSQVTSSPFDHSYDFSIVIRLREQLPAAKLTGKLYDSIKLVNILEPIAEVGIDLEGTVEAEV